MLSAKRTLDDSFVVTPVLPQIKQVTQEEFKVLMAEDLRATSITRKSMLDIICPQEDKAMNKDQFPNGWSAEQRIWLARAGLWFEKFCRDRLPYPHHCTMNMNNEHIELWFDGAKAIGFYPPTEYEQPAFLLSGRFRLASADDAMALLDLAGKSIKLSAKARAHALTLEDNQVADIVTYIAEDTPTPEGRSGWRFQMESFPDTTSLMTYVTTEWAEKLQAYRSK